MCRTQLEENCQHNKTLVVSINSHLCFDGERTRVCLIVDCNQGAHGEREQRRELSRLLFSFPLKIIITYAGGVEHDNGNVNPRHKTSCHPRSLPVSAAAAVGPWPRERHNVRAVLSSSCPTSNYRRVTSMCQNNSHVMLFFPPYAS